MISTICWNARSIVQYVGILGVSTPKAHLKDYKISRKCIICLWLLFLKLLKKVINSKSIRFFYLCIILVVIVIAIFGFFGLMIWSVILLKYMIKISLVGSNMFNWVRNLLFHLLMLSARLEILMLLRQQIKNMEACPITWKKKSGIYWYHWGLLSYGHQLQLSRLHLV